MAITFKKKYKVSGFELSVIFSVVLGSSVASSISTIFADFSSASLFKFICQSSVQFEFQVRSIETLKKPGGVHHQFGDRTFDLFEI